MLIRFLRHGETEWNLTRRIQGTTSYVDLTESAAQSSRLLAEICASGGEPFERLYTSPLLRARRTAEIMGKKLGLAPIEDARLREMSFGRYEGTQYGTSMTGRQFYVDNNIRRCFEDPNGYIPPQNGESFEGVLRRAKSFLADVIALSDDSVGGILAVTHGGLICAVRSLLNGASLSEFWKGTVGNLKAFDVDTEKLGVPGCNRLGVC